jgi:hypothetical protein
VCFTGDHNDSGRKFWRLSSQNLRRDQLCEEEGADVACSDLKFEVVARKLEGCDWRGSVVNKDLERKNRLELQRPSETDRKART